MPHETLFNDNIGAGKFWSLLCHRGAMLAKLIPGSIMTNQRLDNIYDVMMPLRVLSSNTHFGSFIAFCISENSSFLCQGNCRWKSIQTTELSWQ
jgi:hypothetical protein